MVIYKFLYRLQILDTLECVSDFSRSKDALSTDALYPTITQKPKSYPASR